MAYFKGIEFGKLLNNNNSIAIRIAPDFNSNLTNNSPSDTNQTNRDYSIRTSIVLKKELVQKPYFTLNIALIPSYEYSKSSSFLSVGNQIIMTYTDDFEHIADVSLTFEPSFKPHPNVDIFWNLSTGASITYTSNLTNPGSASSAERNKYVNLRYSYPSSINILTQLGVRYYFRTNAN